MKHEQREVRSIASLKPHPRQGEFFRQHTDSEIAELAAQINKDGGIRNPPEVLPDGGILIGYRRIQAARLLGWSEIEVVVRYDLDGDEDRAMQAFIGDNLFRQQLDPISIAKCYEELRMLDPLTANGKHVRGHGELRDRIAERLPVKLSPRHLDRLRRLLKLPQPVLEAIRNGSLKAVHGEILLGRKEDVQNQVAAALLGGEKATSVIQRFGLKSKAKPKSTTIRLASLLKSLDGLLRESQANMESLDGVNLGSESKTLGVLKEGAKFLSELHDRRTACSQIDSPPCRNNLT